MNIVKKIDNLVKVENVLISVFDKGNLEKFVLDLMDINPKIKFYSTGGTYIKINELLKDSHEKNLFKISEYTKQKETQGGLVKSLDFKIYLGLLTETYNKEHQEDMQETQSINFDMVVVNLYPFSEITKQKSVSIEEARGYIDIGGPCMLRASAKNFLRVASVSNKDDYPQVIEELKKNNGKTSVAFRFELMKKTFNYTFSYDQKIAKFYNQKSQKNLEGLYLHE